MSTTVVFVIIKSHDNPVTKGKNDKKTSTNVVLKYGIMYSIENLGALYVIYFTSSVIEI